MKLNSSLMISYRGMEEWRALEKKREKDWEAYYMNVTRSNVGGASIANNNVGEHNGTN
jgi:hypothetical protein